MYFGRFLDRRMSAAFFSFPDIVVSNHDPAQSQHTRLDYTVKDQLGTVIRLILNVG
jgi:hypothetical protein